MFSKEPIRIGVISDTHLPYRLNNLPPEITHIFAGVDLILHAGDVDKIELLKPLENVAPLYAVQGNIHLGDMSWGGRDLPVDLRLTLLERKVVVTHGHRRGVLGGMLKIPEIVGTIVSKAASGSLNDRIVQRLDNIYPHADIIIFGHTHSAYCKVFNETLFFNSGAVAPTPGKWSSVGLMQLYRDRIETEIVPVGEMTYNANGKQALFRQVHIL